MEARKLEELYNELRPLVKNGWEKEWRKIAEKNPAILDVSNQRAMANYTLLFKLVEKAWSAAEFVQMMQSNEPPPVKLAPVEMEVLKGGGGCIFDRLSFPKIDSSYLGTGGVGLGLFEKPFRAIQTAWSNIKPSVDRAFQSGGIGKPISFGTLRPGKK